jgi:hypothetical protein
MCCLIIPRSALLIAFFLLASCKPPSVTQESDLKDAGFIKESDWAKAKVPAFVVNRFPAVEYLYVDSWLSWERGRCSGAFISNEGYFLTAAHCVSHCLSMVKKIDHDKILMSVAFSHGRDKSGRRCDRLKLPLAKLENPEIVYVGGRLVFDLKTVDRATTNDVAAAHKEWRDFAIVKFRTTTKCIPLRKKRLEVGERVWGLGWPASASRNQEGVPSSDGKNRYITYGKVVPNFKTNEVFQRMKLTAAQQTMTRKFVEMPHVLLSNMDGMSGGSGSPIVDKEGMLAGVFTSMVTGNLNPSTEFFNDAAVGIRSETIWSEISAALGQQTANTIFSCM